MKDTPTARQDNVTFRNCTAIRGPEATRPDPHGAAGANCCFVNFGGLLSSFIDNYGEEFRPTRKVLNAFRVDVVPGETQLELF